MISSLPRSLPTSALKAIQEKTRQLAEKKVIQGNTLLWEPHPENQPQMDAYHCQADRLFYGGKAGGGKSDLILGLALTAHHSSIIFRREYPQLKGLIRRSKKIVGSNGRYNGSDKFWSNLPQGRELEFGAVQYEDDVEKFQGRDHSFLAFDEICHFKRSQFDFLCGWNRSTVSGERCRIVATGNPPTKPEGEWVIKYWAPWLDKTHELYPYPPGELLWYITVEGEDRIVQKGGDRPPPMQIEINSILEEIQPHSRTFIPASLEDNPYLAKTGYLSVLQSLPEPLRSRLIHGAFDLEMEDDEWQVIPNQWVELAFQRWETSCPIPSPLSALGVDVARGGKDRTIIAPRRGYWFEKLLSYPGKSTPDGGAVAAQVAKHHEEDCAINIDIVGVGSSVYDILKGTYSRVQAIGGGEKSKRSDRSGQLSFYNKRAEMYWLFREALDPVTGDNIALPRSSALKAELCAPRWSLEPPSAGDERKNGRIKVESKDDITDRLGRSPDEADAVIYAWADQSSEFVAIEHGKKVRDTVPKVPDAEVQPTFNQPKRSRKGWR